MTTRLGILGGGQLAQMLTQAAISLGIETVIFERGADSPAGRLTQHEIVGPWADEAALTTFAERCNLVTLENEFVDATVLRRLEESGLPVYPGSATLAVIQDKLFQKQRITSAGLAAPRFRAVATPAEVAAVAEEYGWPLLLKARREGYDGYGNATLRTSVDIASAWERLSRHDRELLAEAFVPFARELAVMVVRRRDGETRTYPVVETVQHNHICHIVRAPAPVPDHITAQATELAQRAVEAVAGVGIFGVELFLLDDGTVLYNEMAPRPHNSGHYTIEACVTSQFENHLRAVSGWPLGSVDMRAPAAMVNILGQRNGPARNDNLGAALAVPGAHLHIYGKREVRVGRKMGHVTALGATLEEAEAIAQRAAEFVEL
ncbi:MAG: 5-(carboxyamino)imidazole ribonucleotide synthase [Chloroflexales bacterium]|nr:5-(carboxyamino)imidazole ribonucleotide synthase [Chloroflexales bacterium]